MVEVPFSTGIYFSWLGVCALSTVPGAARSKLWFGSKLEMGLRQSNRKLQMQFTYYSSPTRLGVVSDSWCEPIAADIVIAKAR